MTTDKAFKRVVRARMAKTGERYAAARRVLVAGAADGQHAEPTADAVTPSGYRMRGGLHPETATLANVLANQGVVSGLTGEPLTEAAILGIGGGLGAGYILWEFTDAAARSTAGRSSPSDSGISGNTRRSPAGPARRSIGSASSPTCTRPAARRGLARRSMLASTPACPSSPRSTSSRSGPGASPTTLSGHFGLVVVVFGRDADGSYLVDDRGRNPFRVSPAVMAAARGRIGSFKHRIVGLRTTPGPIPAERLRAAMRAGLEDQVDHLRSPSDSFSLPAWRKWSRLMTDERNAKAWPRVFADGHGLFGALLGHPRERRRPGRAMRAGTCGSCLPHRSMKRPSPSTTLRSATRRGRGGASPTNGRSSRTRPSRPISTVQPRRSRPSRPCTRR